MHAFILERLNASGWRRVNDLYWREQDAVSAGRKLIRDAVARSVRILPVTVGLDAVVTLDDTADQSEVPTNGS